MKGANLTGCADGKRQAWKDYLPVSLRIHSLSPKEQWPNLPKGLRRLRLRTLQAEAPGPPKVGRTFGLETDLDTTMCPIVSRPIGTQSTAHTC